MCQNQLRFYRTGKCVNSTLYRSMIWSLLYITICTLNIAFSVGVCTIFQLILKNHILQQLKKSKFKLKAKTIKILACILSIHQTWDWYQNKVLAFKFKL
jgi:hypothetical protein